MIIAKAKQDTRPDGRWYDTDDGRFPSVTTILSVIGKPALVNWAAKVEREAVVAAAKALYLDAPASPRMSGEAYEASLVSRLSKEKAHTRALEKAGQIGSAVHNLIEWNLRAGLGQRPGPQPALPPEGQSCFAAYERWAGETSLAPRAIEQVVWSKSRGYAGTMDLFADVTIDGSRLPVVLDWKTGKAIYREAELQVSAYCHALIEMGHAEPPLHGLIVRLPKLASDPEPEFRLVQWERQGELMEAFAAALRLWTWQQS